MIRLLLLFALAGGLLAAQTVAPDHSHGDDWKAVASISNFAPAAYLFATTAQGATNWRFTAPGGRVYNVSAAEQVSIAGAVIGASLVVRHLYPRTGRYIDAVLMIGAGAQAGRAYAQSLRH